jgi:hypothetical protein
LILYPFGWLSAQEILVDYWLPKDSVLCSPVGECIIASKTTVVRISCIVDSESGVHYLGPLPVPIISMIGVGLFKIPYPFTETFYLEERTLCPEQM